MADQVEISNVGGDGVASEVTLLRLVAAMEKMAGGKGAGGKAAEETKRLAAAASAAGSSLDSNKTSLDNNTKSTNKAAKAAEDFGNKVGRAALAGIQQLLKSTVDFSKELLVGGTGLADFTQHLPGIGSLITPLAAIIDDTVNSFRELSASGASFNNSITEMRRASAESGLTLQEFGGLITQNSENMRYLGGTVTQGAQRFVQMNKGLKDIGEFEQLKAMGFTVLEINEGMADYIGLQARMGTLQGKSTKELAEGSAAYLKQIDMLAKVTGMTRKEAEAALQAQAADAGARAMLNALGEGTQEFKNLQASMAMIEKIGGPTATALKDLLDGVANTEEGQKMIAAAGPEVAEALRQVGKGANPQVLLDAMKKAGGDLEKFAGLEGQERAAFIANLRQTDPVLAGLLDGATQMIAQGGADLKAAQQEQAARDEVTKKLATFDDSIRKIRESIQVMLIDSGIFELVASGLGVFADIIGGVANAIKGFTTAIANGDIWGAITSLFTGTGAVAALAGGILALFLGKAALSAIASGIGGLMGKLTKGITGGIGRMFGGGGGPMSTAASAAGNAGGAVKPSSAGKGFGQALGNIGKGLGAGIGGILKGLAGGLAAFANPAILIGAGILGGAIIAIGAGIAGATWLMGKALPTLAEGLKAFSDIDGDNLLKVAGGIAAVGAALAAMGAGAAIGAVGNTIANIIEMLPGKGPLEKLVEFSKLDMNAARVEANAKAAVAFSKAMASMGAGGAAGSIGNLVANVFDGIVSFFGGSTSLPYDKMIEFGNVILPKEKIEANAKAVVAFGDALKSIPAINTGRTGGLFEAISSIWRGNKTYPWDSVKEFGKELLDPTGNILANSMAIRAFGEAMSTVPQIDTGRSGGLFGAISAIWSGGVTYPWDSVKEFGKELLDPTGNVLANAIALRAFGEAMSTVPQIDTGRSGGLFGAIAAIWRGGVTYPWDGVKEFGKELIDPTGNVLANAIALRAFGEAMSTVPQVDTERSGGIFGAIAAIWRGGAEYPWEKVKEFGSELLDPQGNVLANAMAVSAFGQAMSGFPTIDAERTGGVFGAIASIFGGGKTYPWDKVKEFGEVPMDIDAIIRNASAMDVFGTALSNLTSRNIAEFTFDDELLDQLEDIAALGTTGLPGLSQALTSMAELPDMASKFEFLKSLDAENLIQYNRAMQELVNHLAKLNEELAKDNKGLFGGGTGVSAADALKQISVSTSSGSQNTGEMTALLNEILGVLLESKTLNEKIERNTADVGGYDLLTTNVSRF